MILAVIPARGGSRELPKKNIRRLAARPLISYTITAALKAHTLDKVIVSTNDERIARIAKKWGAEVPFLRPRYLAQDSTPMVPVVQHAVKRIERLTGRKVDIIVLLQPTSPLRAASDIDRGVRKILTSKADSVIGVCKLEYLCHPCLVKRIKGDKIYSYLKSTKAVSRRQALSILYRLNGALYIVRRDILMNKNSFYGQDTRALIMDKAKSIDIDSQLDLQIAEALLKKRNKKYA